MNNYTKAFIHQMSRRTGTPLTDRHMEILEFANEYYFKNRVGPLFNILKKKLGVSKEDLNQLFPNGLFSVYSWIGIPIQDPNHICKPIATVDVEDYREVYLDHNGTTAVRDEVSKILLAYFRGDYGFGNPSSSTLTGKKAYENIFSARANIAQTLNVISNEIIFTGCGSEANNHAIKGIAFNHLKQKGHIISSQIEHPSVLNTLSWLEEQGFEITLVDVEPDGIVSPEKVEKAIRNNTILISIMAVNNELGTINPIEKIGKICEKRNIPLMVDAIQAYGKIKLEPKKSGISLMSISGHKIYAPKGIGALFVDERISLSPLIHGGEQEFGQRSGTENVSFMMAFAKAAVLMHKEMKSENKRLTSLNAYFLEKLTEHVIDFVVNGSNEQCLPSTLNIGFPGIDSGALLLSLNQIGVSVSSGSACSAGSQESSYVIQALGIDTRRYGNVRFSMGLHTRRADIDYLFKYLPHMLKQLKNLDRDS